MSDTYPPLLLQIAVCVWVATSVVALYAAWRFHVTLDRQIAWRRDETARLLSGGRGRTTPPRFTWWG